MKKLFLGLLITALALTSCDNGSDYSYEELGIYPVVEGPYVVYPDQEVDSFTLVSSRSWKATVEGEWIILDPAYSYRQTASQEIKTLVCPIYFNTNTTGDVRIGYLKVDGNKRRVGRMYMQTYWLNITLPQVTFASGTTTEDYKGANFQLNATKDEVTKNIEFNIYAEQATLTTEADWVTLPQNKFESGNHKLEITLEPNTTGAERKAVLRLSTSNGISTDIVLTQKN